MSQQPKQECSFGRKEGMKLLHARLTNIRTEDHPFKLTTRSSIVILTRDISVVRAETRLWWVKK